MKKYEPLIYSAVGLVALFLILVAVNFLVSRVPARLDLTEGNLYTLSPGTKKILANLQAQVKLKVYVSQGESVPVQLRGFAQRVEDVVREFKSAAGANLVVERYNPRPDSEEEDAAQLDGIEPQQLFTGEQFYLGVAVTQLDRKQTLPNISPQRERLLEYDLVRAIARVGSSERPKIGLMAGLPVLGERFNPFTRQSSDPWVLANELKREFDVREVPLTAKEIDKEINVLLVIHPRDIQPVTEYALDQFVMRGGKLIVFVDPYAYFDQMPTMPGVPPTPSASTLPTLFKTWGVQMDPGKVVADVVFGSGRRRPLHADRALAQSHRVQPRRHRHRANRNAALRLRRRVRAQDAGKPESDRARAFVAELDAGRHHERDQIRRRSNAQLQPFRQSHAARPAAYGQVHDRIPGGREGG